MITIRGRPVPVDVRAELEQYEWSRARWTDEKLIAASPFRYDRTPSFFVNIDEHSEYYGCWADSGAYDTEWASGGFVRLLAFLRSETYEETEDYLLAAYGCLNGAEAVELTLPTIRLPSLENRVQTLSDALLESYRYRHPYLVRRGISEQVQRAMGVGYDRERRAITIPWRLPDGRLANIKYRRVDSKVFWYEKGGMPTRSLVYGIDVIYRRAITQAVVCEAEIDVMSFMTAGVPAVAIGGVAFTDEKADVLRRSPLRTLVIAVDNDKAGAKLKRVIAEKLTGYLELRELTLPSEYKDANDALVGGLDLRKVYSESSKVISTTFSMGTRR